jgi:hypothetical protein
LRQPFVSKPKAKNIAVARSAQTRAIEIELIKRISTSLNAQNVDERGLSAVETRIPGLTHFDFAQCSKR